MCMSWGLAAHPDQLGLAVSTSLGSCQLANLDDPARVPFDAACMGSTTGLLNTTSILSSFHWGNYRALLLYTCNWYNSTPICISVYGFPNEKINDCWCYIFLFFSLRRSVTTEFPPFLLTCVVNMNMCLWTFHSRQWYYIWKPVRRCMLHICISLSLSCIIQS